MLEPKKHSIDPASPDMAVETPAPSDGFRPVALVDLDDSFIPPPYGTSPLYHGFSANLISPDSDRTHAFRVFLSPSTAKTLVRQTILAHLPQQAFQQINHSCVFTSGIGRQKGEVQANNVNPIITPQLSYTGLLDFEFGIGTIPFRHPNALVVKEFYPKHSDYVRRRSKDVEVILGVDFLIANPGLVLKLDCISLKSEPRILQSLYDERKPLLNISAQGELVISAEGFYGESSPGQTPRAGLGVYFTKGSGYNSFYKLVEMPQRQTQETPVGTEQMIPPTLQRAEVAAVIAALKMARMLLNNGHKFASVRIRTNSAYFVEAFAPGTGGITSWAEKKWATSKGTARPNRDLLEDVEMWTETLNGSLFFHTYPPGSIRNPNNDDGSIIIEKVPRVSNRAARILARMGAEMICVQEMDHREKLLKNELDSLKAVGGDAKAFKNVEDKINKMHAEEDLTCVRFDAYSGGISGIEKHNMLKGLKASDEKGEEDESRSTKGKGKPEDEAWFYLNRKTKPVADGKVGKEIYVNGTNGPVRVIHDGKINDEEKVKEEVITAPELD